VGDLFADLSITVIVGQTVGFLVSVYLTPTFAYLLHDNKETALSFISGKPESLLPGRTWLAPFSRCARWILSRSSACALLHILLSSIVILSFFGAPPSEFLPIGNSEEYSLRVDYPVGSSARTKQEITQKVEDFTKKIGFTNRLLMTQSAGIHMSLTYPFSESSTLSLDLTEMNRRLRNITFPFPSGLYQVSPLEPKSREGEDLEIFTEATDRERTRKFVQELRRLPGVAGVTFSADNEVQALSHHPAKSGLYSAWVPEASQSDVIQLFRTSVPLGNTGVVTDQLRIRKDSSNVAVQKEKPIVFDASSDTLLTLTGATQVPRSLLESGFNLKPVPSELYMVEGKNRDKVAVDLHGKTSGEIEEEMNRLADIHGIHYLWHPKTRENQEGFRQLLICLASAVVIIALLVYLHNFSIRLSFVILFTFLWGPIGSIPGLLLHAETFNASALVGVILLAGTIVNNGILLVDLIDSKRRAQVPPVEACLSAIRERSVNVLITSLTTVLGMLPMVFETGAGSQMYRGLAVVVFYGTLISAPLSLIGVPSLVILLSSVHERFTRALLRLQVLLMSSRPAQGGRSC
jgi:HAE1 family hydrophobic/amphiphilic exporter-1